MENLQDKAAIFLEEWNFSGDTMINMDHNLDNLDRSKIGAMYVHDIMAAFVEHINKCESQKKDICEHDFSEPFYNQGGELMGYHCIKCGEEQI